MVPSKTSVATLKLIIFQAILFITLITTTMNCQPLQYNIIGNKGRHGQVPAWALALYIQFPIGSTTISWSLSDDWKQELWISTVQLCWYFPSIDVHILLRIPFTTSVVFFYFQQLATNNLSLISSWKSLQLLM